MRSLALGMSTMLAVTLVSPVAFATAAKGAKPAVQAVKPVPGVPLATHRKPQLGSAGTPQVTPVPQPPVSGTAVADLSSGVLPGGGLAGRADALPAARVRAGVLPVWVAAPAASAGQAAAVPAPSTPAKVSVTVADQQAAAAAGVNGMLLWLIPADGATGGRLSVDVGYAALASHYGADFARRVRLVSLPACALTTPQVAACRVQTPVPGAANDPAARELTATVQLSAPATPAAASARTPGTQAATASTATVLAAASTGSGSTGTFSATSLSPSSQWSAGTNTGSFTWTYPVDAPAPFAGSAPSVSLTYDSSSVDGLTDTTNNQSSPVGEGFDLATGGFIERSYQTCSQFTDLPKAEQTGDECWDGQILNVSLGGKSSALVWDPATNVVHPADDNGERVEHLTGASNGALNGEYWKITTTDGTQFYFGRNHGPGYTGAAGQANTNSTWTVPVYGAHSGDPCYNATFTQASCTQAWRWNLDYVEDVHGNVTMYYYSPETNYYVPDSGQNGTTSVQYTRGGLLAHIDYGIRDDNGTVYANKPVDTIVFTPAERCIANEGGDGFNCDPSQFNQTNAVHWHDVPYDQNCDQGKTCTDYAPSFWSRKRITAVTTQVLANGQSGGYSTVDSYNLTESYPDPGDGTSPALWLAQVQRFGSDGVTSTPPVMFNGTMGAGRVGISLQDNYPVYNKMRMVEIDTETGEQIQVHYAPHSCSPTNLPSSESTNTSDCYPEYWIPWDHTTPIESYFYKYLVSQVMETDPTGGAPDKVTNYAYTGGAAWHYDDSELGKAANRTYSQFRGYAHVQARTGASPAPITLTDTLFFRGMDGDILPGGGKRSASVSDVENDDTVVDNNALAGQTFEADTYTADGGTVDHATVSDYTVTGPTATRARTGLNSLQALMVLNTRTRTRQALAAGGWRRTVTNTAYNSVGMPTQVDDEGDGSSPRCSRSTFVTNTAAWLTLVSRLTETAEVCPAGSQAGTLVADTETSYDNQAWGAAPMVGNPTSVATASATTGGVAGITAYVTATAGFDSYGRKISATDTMGRQSSTAFTPATLGPVTQTVATDLASTDPLSRSTTTIVDPLRGLTTANIDVAGLRSDATFDALGRLTQAWIPGRSKAGGQSPNTVYTYDVSNTGPSVVITQSLMDDNTYSTAETLYDALLRERQTQKDAEGGGRIVADTEYDSHGWTIKTNHEYFATGAPSTTVYQVGDAAVPDQTITTYDGMGQGTTAAEYHYSNYTWETDTVHGGDRTTTIPPAGATATTTVTDVRGDQIELDEYSARPTVTGDQVSGPVVGAGTKYGYDPAGHQTTVTDPTGKNSWTAVFDLRGRKLSETDPDTGRTQYTYDNDGEMLTSTDSRNQTIAYTYDNLGRKAGEYSGSTTGPRIARWTYDTLMKGKPTASVSYSNGLAYISSASGYNSAGLSTGTTVTIPSGEGALYGTYTTSYGYTPNTNKVATVAEPAAGPFGAETVTTTYDHLGNPTSTMGQNAYVAATSYSSFGEPLQYTQGPSGNPVWQTFSYDDQTRRLTESRMDRQAAPPQVDKVDYTYNPGGQITQITDLRQAVTTDTQCFGYDGVGELTQAWTATDDCAANPSVSGNATVGGLMPYWTTWQFDMATGNRRSQVQHALPGSSGGDTTTAYTYNAPGAGQPHAVQSTSTSGPSGTTGTSYQYDPAGDTSNRTTPATGAQTLTWDVADRLTSVAAGSATTGFVYDADGKELIRKDPGQNTLYLGDTELVLNTATGAVSGTRYYKQGPDTVATLDSGTGHVFYQMPNNEGTANVELDSVTGVVTFRSYDPYGAVRGAAPASWSGQRGYLGVGTTDSTTGLTDLGAREYDPGIGAFVSPDPKFDGENAQNMGGYAYSGNDPVSMSDPTGLFWGSHWLKKHIKAVVAVAVVVAVVTVAVVAAPVAIAAGAAALEAAAGAAATATTVSELAIPAAVAAGGVLVSEGATAAGAGVVATSLAVAGRVATGLAGGGEHSASGGAPDEVPTRAGSGEPETPGAADTNADVYWHRGHATIAVRTTSGETVVGDAMPGHMMDPISGQPRRINSPRHLDEDYLPDTEPAYSTTLPDPDAAAAYIKDQERNGADPKYRRPWNTDDNSCITYCADVLNAGGDTQFAPGPDSSQGTSRLKRLINYD